VTALHPLPASVTARCAATDGIYGSAHGAAATGVNDLAGDNAAESLAYLAADMRAAYAHWLAEQEETR
jgi:hypothetical protein